MRELFNLSVEKEITFYRRVQGVWFGFICDPIVNDREDRI